MRGEYIHLARCCSGWSELPPRARRIHEEHELPQIVPGTTSACAENTRHVISSTPYFWNYLRVRGEYLLIICRKVIGLELPPRARRILAGFSVFLLAGRNYLRVRGEYRRSVLILKNIQELPPRARRIRKVNA